MTLRKGVVAKGKQKQPSKAKFRSCETSRVLSSDNEKEADATRPKAKKNVTDCGLIR